MVSHFVTLCLALLPLAQCIQIHKHMTEREVQKTFQTGHDNVPDYQIVRLYHTLHKRDISENSTRMVKLIAFKRELSLYLEPTQGLLAGVSTPVWTVTEHFGWPVGPKYTLQPNVLANIGRAYQDVSKRSAIVAYEGKDGETLFFGNLLEHNITIRPLPHHLHDTILRETRDLVDFLPDGVDGEADFRRSHHHVVFKRDERDMNANDDGIRVVKRNGSSSGAIDKDGWKTSIPDIIYPEILIIVDSILYVAIGKDLEEVVRYVLAFWNAVDLRYRLLEEPIIRLNIASIIISLEPRGTPYLTSYPRNSTQIVSEMALDVMSRYFYAESHKFPFATYDFAMAMTGLDMCTRKTNGVCGTSMSSSTAYWRGACNRNPIQMITEAVGIVEDNGGYMGIMAAAHEVATLMGAPPDGSEEAIDCPATDGYLMAPSRKFTENQFQWSRCSLEYLYEFLSEPKSTCLRNKPQAGQALRRLVPGQLLSLDEQCKKIHGTKACDHGAHVCVALACYVPGNSTLCQIVSAAAEGSSCGNGWHCINGYCVNKRLTHVPYRRIPIGKPFN